MLLQLKGVEKMVRDHGMRGSAASSGGSLMGALWGHREADITSAEYSKARAALSGLSKRWEQLASAATQEDVPRQRQRGALTKKDRDTLDLLRGQVGSCWMHRYVVSGALPQLFLAGLYMLG
jgi:hypothetical protein